MSDRRRSISPALASWYSSLIEEAHALLNKDFLSEKQRKEQMELINDCEHKLRKNGYTT